MEEGGLETGLDTEPLWPPERKQSRQVKPRYTEYWPQQRRDRHTHKCASQQGLMKQEHWQLPFRGLSHVFIFPRPCLHRCVIGYLGRAHSYFLFLHFLHEINKHILYPMPDKQLLLQLRIISKVAHFRNCAFKRFFNVIIDYEAMCQQIQEIIFFRAHPGKTKS